MNMNKSLSAYFALGRSSIDIALLSSVVARLMGMVQSMEHDSELKTEASAPTPKKQKSQGKPSPIT